MALREPEPIRITTAPRSRRDDIAARQRRYLISMAIRTACFVAAVAVALSSGPGWLLWSLVAASFVLPYVAVVMANAGSSPDPGGPEPFGPDTGRKAIGG